MKKDKRQTDAAKTGELSLKNEIIGILLLFFAIFFIFSVVSYNPGDASFFNSTPHKTVINYGGKIGSEVSALLFNLFGYASFVLLFYLLFITSYFLLNKKIQNMITKSAGYLLLLVSGSAFISAVEPYVEIGGQKVKSGGIVGYFINRFFQGQLKPTFTFLFFLLLIVIAMILIAKLSLRAIGTYLLRISLKAGVYLKGRAVEQLEKYRKYQNRKKVEEKYKADESRRLKLEKKEQKKRGKIDKEQHEKILGNPGERSGKKPSGIPEEGLLFASLDENGNPDGPYQAPPITYLDAPNERSKIDFKELEEKKDELSQRLEEFRIRGDIVEYTPGPVITTYEFVPDTGVKVKDVTNLSEDLALVARAQYVRIERILGKKAIGIEVPNKKREIIHLREIIESEEYRNATSPLTLALGKSKNGEIFISDLQEMPHLIIAGATGSGKSVAIHTVILSILFKASPDEVKFVFIDPKRVELALYNSLPHLLTPVVVNTKQAKNALDWAVFEMERRYKMLAMLQVRNLEQYNRKLDLLVQSEDESLEKLDDTEKIPYIVIVIDEFADLMMECSRDIENDVARIAQKARAVGIHLILATQRPSTDVITGTIKNNFPSRIAMAVPSKHDSRTIIDVMGAEKLLGNGDMLFLPPKTASLIRLHCAFVSEQETLRVVNYLAKTGKPKYNTDVVKPLAKEGEGEGADADLDDMFFAAAEVAINSGQASASFLQRKMSIGYARAGRLIDQLQANGVVSASDSKNKREVLMTLAELDDLRPRDGLL